MSQKSKPLPSEEEMENQKLNKVLSEMHPIPNAQYSPSMPIYTNNIAAEDKTNMPLFSNLYNPNESFIPANGLFKEEQDKTISIKERSLRFFSDIIGNEEIKENMYRALIQENRTINILLSGPPATSKTLLCKVIESSCNGVLFFDAAAGSTGSGLVELLRQNKGAKVLIIDEISELKKNDIDLLRGLLNDGRVSRTLKSKPVNFKMNGLRVFATTNNPTKLSLPIKSRFQIYQVNGYNNEEFIQVLSFCLLKQKIVNSEQMSKELAYAMLHYQIKNIRTALSVCSLISNEDTHEDIKRIIEQYLENDGSMINVNYNEEME